MANSKALVVIDMGIDTHQEPLVYMREDCHVCRAEGFNASSRVLLKTNDKHLIATLNIVDNTKLPPDHVGLSRIAIKRLDVTDGDRILVTHAPVILSFSAVRKKVYGHTLSDREILSIVSDISEHRYSDVEIGSFLSVCAGRRLDPGEIISLTQAMVSCGKRLSWSHKGGVFDKHCIGGLPGNRTTPLVVAIVSAAGLIIPKTSSRAITSPAGTADTMETLTNVKLQVKDIQRVVAETGACLAWGGAMNLSPADDLLIRIERALNLDGEGQLIASVLSKKIAAGSTHVIIDIPVGHTAKVRSQTDAEYLSSLFAQVGEACGIQVRCVITDGSRPVGAGIGPVEEARDILAILKQEANAPQDLRDRALMLSAHLLDFAQGDGFDKSRDKARDLLDSGAAWQQFERILAAQGGIKTLPQAGYQKTQTTSIRGVIQSIDNRKLARLAKLAGAPFDPAAGLRLHANVGSHVSRGDALFTLYTDSAGEQDYALAYYRDNPGIFVIGDDK
ncbi:MAG: thymidine phosphorylase [Gammaproteobacteria bacterium]|nr:MAG: thymidine phosphorylase [Gammaproteobacteria bacterium]RLA44889.1 MAG: thymidine phosphorylase [Gammaproteobacteria bacterium]